MIRTCNHAQVRLMLVLAPATCCLAGIGAHEALLLFARYTSSFPSFTWSGQI